MKKLIIVMLTVGGVAPAAAQSPQDSATLQEERTPVWRQSPIGDQAFQRFKPQPTGDERVIEGVLTLLLDDTAFIRLLYPEETRRQLAAATGRPLAEIPKSILQKYRITLDAKAYERAYLDVGSLVRVTLRSVQSEELTVVEIDRLSADPRP